ncbi:TraB/GumN family protein [Flavobacterium sp. 245]|uniref:TraB/GumN family protein n=1 Tax=Flavobacterium sp. 245 TaxID=2512115 RepID=UPI00105E4ABB|nr:TraB/GumN family protein [Flavobacterium sp. 245]TDO95462.1 hypothetical protein EV145_11482 [Flavobacterium sp. 245]
MKNLLTSAIAVILLVFSGKTQAQTKSPKLENSLLWEVSGNGLAKPSYLYGTVHMICAGDFFLTEKTKKAFASSEKLVLEVNLADPKELSDMQKMAMGKEPLSKKLTPTQLADLDKILKTTTGMSVQQVDSFTLMTVMSLISVKTFGCTDLKFYEMSFIEMAKSRNIETVGLETIKSQLESVDKAFSDDEMIASLAEYNTNETTKLVTNYKSENLGELFKGITDEKYMNAKARKYMLDNRNENWVTQLPEMMKKESVFVAVGAGHLGGELGLINLLRKAGYIVKPVMN